MYRQEIFDCVIRTSVVFINYFKENCESIWKKLVPQYIRKKFLTLKLDVLVVLVLEKFIHISQILNPHAFFKFVR